MQQILLLGVMSTQVAVLSIRITTSAYNTQASVPADIVACAAIASLSILSYVSHQRSARPSTLIALYLSVVALLGAAKVPTFWLIEPRSALSATLIANYTLIIMALGVESIEEKASLTSKDELQSPEYYSGFWARTLFSWLLGTFRTGYSKIISVEDLPPLDPCLESQVLHERLAQAVERCESIANKRAHSD